MLHSDPNRFGILRLRPPSPALRDQSGLLRMTGGHGFAIHKSSSMTEYEWRPRLHGLYNDDMQTINVSKFREHRLAILENLGTEGIVITKHGKPIARVIPASSDCAELIGSMKGKIKIRGDIISTDIKWNAQS